MPLLNCGVPDVQELTETPTSGEYAPDAAVIRAALPLLLADPLYRASIYAPRHPELDRLSAAQVYQTIPATLRWNRRTQGKLAADLLTQLLCLRHIHGPLVTALFPLPLTGSLYTQHTVSQATGYLRWAVQPEFSAVWRLQKDQEQLQLQVTAPPESLAQSLLPLTEWRVVSELFSHAQQLAQPGDTGLCFLSQPWRPDPAEVARVVLEYLHSKSQGNFTRRDWETVPAVRGYLTGERERRAAALGQLNGPEVRLNGSRR